MRVRRLVRMRRRVMRRVREGASRIAREPICFPGVASTHAPSKSIDASSSVKSNPTESEIRDWCVAYLAKSLKLAPERIDPQAKFARLGMDSAASVFLVRRV